MEQKLDNLLNLNTKHKQTKYTNKQVLHIHQNVTNISFKKILTEILELGFNYTIKKPTRLYIQDLNSDTENGTGQLDTKILIALANKISPFTN